MHLLFVLTVTLFARVCSAANAISNDTSSYYYGSIVEYNDWPVVVNNVSTSTKLSTNQYTFPKTTRPTSTFLPLSTQSFQTVIRNISSLDDLATISILSTTAAYGLTTTNDPFFSALKNFKCPYVSSEQVLDIISKVRDFIKDFPNLEFVKKITAEIQNDIATVKDYSAKAQKIAENIYNQTKTTAYELAQEAEKKYNETRNIINQQLQIAKNTHDQVVTQSEILKNKSHQTLADFKDKAQKTINDLTNQTNIEQKAQQLAESLLAAAKTKLANAQGFWNNKISDAQSLLTSLQNQYFNLTGIILLI
jgi:hypothetical protein